MEEFINKLLKVCSEETIYNNGCLKEFLKDKQIDFNDTKIFEKVIFHQFHLKRYNHIETFINFGLDVNSLYFFCKESIDKKNFRLFKMLVDNNFDLFREYKYCPYFTKCNTLKVVVSISFIGLIVQKNLIDFLEYVQDKIDFKNYKVIPCFKCLDIQNTIYEMNLMDLAIYSCAYKIIPFLNEKGVINTQCLNLYYCKDHPNFYNI